MNIVIHDEDVVVRIARLKPLACIAQDGKSHQVEFRFAIISSQTTFEALSNQVLQQYFIQL